MSRNLHRRMFLRTAAATAAASSLPGWFTEECRGQITETAGKAASDRPLIALVGCGGRGRGIAEQAAEFGEVVTVCDVDERHLAVALETWPEATAEKDFRRVMEQKNVDVVVCGTVDHWHALVAAAAMNAGKDVYCEKPLTLTVDEGKHLISVARATGRVLQTGSQQKSDARFRLACELVRNGRIGKLKMIETFLPAGRREGPFVAGDPPAGFDWDFWQGPTPRRNFVPERTHVTFRYWWDYSGGTMTDWGAHHNDIALWGMGLERSGPTSIKGRALVDMIEGGFTAASEYQVEYQYANGVAHSCHSTAANAWNGQVVDDQGQRHGIRFTGSDGWIWVTRGDIEASDPELLVEPFASSAERLPVSNNHMGNFFDSVRTRRPPICDVEVGHRSASLCHLGVLAIRLGRPLNWDPVAESFVNDSAADGWLSRESYGNWS